MTAANKHRGQLGVEVGDKKLIFAFTTNALCEVEEAFDLKDISEIEKVIADSPSLRTIRTLFRIGLTDCQPDMTDREAGDIMQAVGGLEPSLELIMRAVETAFPGGSQEGTENPPANRQARRAKNKSRGTGPSST